MTRDRFGRQIHPVKTATPASTASATAAATAEAASTVASPSPNPTSGELVTLTPTTSTLQPHSRQTLRKLIETGAFNCQYCGLFFKTAVFCVLHKGTVCETCLNTNRWQGERLQFFDVALADLPVLPCTNAFAGCQLQVLPEDLDVHLENCYYRPVNCISPGCRWLGKQYDLVEHFGKMHQKDMIDERTTFDLDVGLESFMNVKLVTQGIFDIFTVIRRDANSGRILYNAFEVYEGISHDLAVKHSCDANEYYTKCLRTEQLNAIDKTWAENSVSLTVLREISGNANKLHLTVDMGNMLSGVQ